MAKDMTVNEPEKKRKEAVGNEGVAKQLAYKQKLWVDVNSLDSTVHQSAGSRRVKAEPSADVKLIDLLV